MAAAKRDKPEPALVAEWPLPGSATLGSAVRVEGIERELRARLPWAVRRRVSVETGKVSLQMAAGEEAAFASASNVIAGKLTGIEALPILPREVEDILSITSHERRKWTKDGRLPSVGTRTVKLRGRAKKVTFHVFDPRAVEDALDRDLAAVWREADTLAKTEARQRAAGKAALKRAAKAADSAVPGPEAPPAIRQRTRLKGWDSFDQDGLLR
ncbi:MAG: hypothetical protein DI629_12660 [Mesorhizobium amorphae]|nr:MAG: hypothetical protein DI629_12660 [Mesorhizobium amorphae]